MYVNMSILFTLIVRGVFIHQSLYLSKLLKTSQEIIPSPYTAGQQPNKFKVKFIIQSHVARQVAYKIILHVEIPMLLLLNFPTFFSGAALPMRFFGS